MKLRALAPAKLNLGLEILGRRDDGFHEIRTILATVSLFDRLTIQRSSEPGFHVDDPNLSQETNLVERAMKMIERDHSNATAHIALRKRIPTAAGLGGASSDAAAALIALDRCFVLNNGNEKLTTYAAELGSDLPFFLSGGLALVSGRGEVVTQLQPLHDQFAIIVAPHVHIPAKTATLYRSLVPSDFSDGLRVEWSAKQSPVDSLFSESSLRNAFERPLYQLQPDLAELHSLLRSCGARVVALSGAGPAHYAPESDLERARNIARQARFRFGTSASVHLVRFISHGAITATVEAS